MILLTEELDITLNLICDVRYNLNGLSQIITAALFVYNRLVDTSGCHRVGFSGLDTCESLVVSEVKVCFHTINCNITFSMLVRIQSAWINVNIWIKLLDSDIVASGLQKLTY